MSKKLLNEGGSASGLIFRFDRGSQYAGYGVNEVINDGGFIQSLKNRENCYDNNMSWQSAAYCLWKRLGRQHDFPSAEYALF